MKALLLLSLAMTFAACSTNTTTTNATATNNEDSYTLEQIAEKSNRLNTDLKSDLDLLIPESVNNSTRTNGKEATKTNISTNETTRNTTTK